jgi:hypothetical protein
MSKSCSTKKIAQYDRWATSVDRNHQQQYAAWLRKINWSWYVTLTFDREVGSMQASALLELYLRDLEIRSRNTLSCLIVKEQKHYSGLGTPAGRVHFHVLVSTTADLTAKDFVDQWGKPQYGGERTSGPSALVRPYDAAISATYYLFKTLYESPDNWELRREKLLGPIRPASWHTSAEIRSAIRRQKARSREARRRDAVRKLAELRGGVEAATQPVP